MSYSQKYIQYLKSNQWKQRRAAALERAKFQCQFEKCGEKQSLEVHHKTYDRLGNEDPGDLIVLCRGHHWHVHKAQEPPILKTLRKYHSYHEETLCKTGIKFLRRLPKKTISKRYKRNQQKLDRHIRRCNNCSF